MTRHIVAGSAPTSSPMVHRPSPSSACTAQLDLSRPRRYADPESAI